MRLELEKLPQNSAWSYHYAPGELELNDDFVQALGKIEVSGNLIKATDNVQLTGQFQVTLALLCDRCTTPVILNLRQPIRAVYVLLEAIYSTEGANLTDEDFALLVYNGAFIELDDIVRDETLLALPDQVLCKTDCLGLCHLCGANQNELPCSCAENQFDPRWSALRQLKL